MPMRVLKEEIKIIVVRPDKQPYIESIRNSMSDIYGLVYYPYVEIPLGKDLFLLANKELKLENFKFNRMVAGVKIYGTFIIVGRQGSDLKSLTQEQINIWEGSCSKWEKLK